MKRLKNGTMWRLGIITVLALTLITLSCCNESPLNEKAMVEKYIVSTADYTDLGLFAGVGVGIVAILAVCAVI